MSLNACAVIACPDEATIELTTTGMPIRVGNLPEYRTGPHKTLLCKQHYDMIKPRIVDGRMQNGPGGAWLEVTTRTM